jgi:hypothetical protein
MGCDGDGVHLGSRGVLLCEVCVVESVCLQRRIVNVRGYWVGGGYLPRRMRGHPRSGRVRPHVGGRPRTSGGTL